MAEAVSSQPLTQRPGHYTRPFHVGAHKVARGRALLRVVRVTPVSIIPSVLHNHSSVMNAVWPQQFTAS
jgi:hypothetical protein